MTIHITWITALIAVAIILITYYSIRLWLVYKTSKLIIEDYSKSFPRNYWEIDYNKLIDLFGDYSSKVTKGFIFYYDVYILTGLNSEFLDELEALCTKLGYSYMIKTNVFTQSARLVFTKQ